jgi:triphosphoribosyl-dephospho-CoA synthetase
MFSNSMSAHLHELIGSFNLSYQYYAKEKGIYSIQLEYIIQSLYELINNKDEFNIQEFIEKIELMYASLNEKENKLQVEDPNKEDDLFGTSYMFMKSMTFAQSQMTVAIAERILNQRYFIQFYELEEEQAAVIKKFLKSIILFLNRFSKTTI